MKKWKALVLVAMAGINPTRAAAAQSIKAAGATFPIRFTPDGSAIFRKLHPGIQIDYQNLGSGAGLQEIMSQEVDFGASDMALMDMQIASLEVKPLHSPTVLGAVVLAYNLPGVTQDLKFTPGTLSGIYLGTIAKWNDAKLAKDNPGVKLPARDILVVVRADGSGTTFAFTDYLSKVSPEWKTRVGSGTTVPWPRGLAGKGNDGVTDIVRQTPMSIGYVELIYALQNRMAYGMLRHLFGVFVRASPSWSLVALRMP